MNEPMIIDDLSNLSSADLAKKIKEMMELKRQKAEEERAAKPPSKRGRGILEFTKKTLLEQPNITNDDLFQMLIAKFGSASRTVMETVRSDFKHSLRVLKEAGRLKDDPDEEKVIEEKVEEKVIEETIEEKVEEPETNRRRRA